MKLSTDEVLELRNAVQTDDSTDSTSPLTTMRAAIVARPGEVEMRTVTLPRPGKSQVRIRLEGSGVCSSNIPVWEGRDWFSYPQEPGAPGHEGWGVIDAVGSDVHTVRPGDRVAALSYRAYAEYDIAEADAVVRLPDELTGIPFPGEPLGCAMNIFKRSEIKAGQTVAVVGTGFLGLLLVQLAVHAGARVIALNRRTELLEYAERFGADATIAMDDHWKIIEKVKEPTGGVFCDCVIEATGKEWPLNLAGELTRERGRLVVAGFHQDGMRQVNMQLWNWRGLDVINAHERDPKMYIEGMQAAVDAVRDGVIDPSPLYTHTFALNRLDDALEHTTNRPQGFIKALVLA